MMNLATRFNYGQTNVANGGGLMQRGDVRLSHDQLRQFVPSIFTTEAHESRSERYSHIPTFAAVEALERNGFFPVFACEAKARAEHKAGFMKHMIRFRRDTDTAVAAIGALPELVLINSHDGTTSYQLLAGFFRSVCANGLICGDTFAGFRVHHKGNVVDSVIEGAFSVTETFTKAIGAAEQMKAITLSAPERHLFAHAALRAREGAAEEGDFESALTEEQILRTRRSEDTSADLWTTFNVAQENLIRGGLRTVSVNAETGKRRRNTTRAVKSVDTTVSLNKKLWNLAEEFSKLKSAN